MLVEIWQFFLSNLEAAGMIGSYVSISIVFIVMLTHFSKDKLHQSFSSIHKKWHPFIGGLLGLIPGCGGTIFVASMYKKKHLSFGGLFAVFSTTLGEGAFILLGASSEGDFKANINAFLLLSAIGFATGVGIGLILDTFHIHIKNQSDPSCVSCDVELKPKKSEHWFIRYGFYVLLIHALLLFPSSLFALWGGSLPRINQYVGWLNISFAVLSLFYYFVYTYILKETCCDQDFKTLQSTLMTAVFDVAIITSYVLLSLILFNVIIDIVIGVETFKTWMLTSGIIVVLISSLIGLLPGCGGMIVVTTAFVTIPSFPIAALIASGIATSGDGVFPLFVSNKKDALSVMMLGFILSFTVGYLVLILA